MSSFAWRNGRHRPQSFAGFASIVRMPQSCPFLKPLVNQAALLSGLGLRCRSVRQRRLFLIFSIFNLSILALWLAASASFLAPPAAAQDNIDEPRSDDIDGPHRIDRRLTVGGYMLVVEAEASNLSLGTALVSVAVLEEATGTPVPEARVVIHTERQATGETGWATALSVPERPEIYRARMKLDLPGSWLVTVEVDGPLGRADALVGAITIPEPRQYWAGSLVFAGMSALLLCGLLYVLWEIRRAQRQRAQRQRLAGIYSPPGGQGDAP